MAEIITREALITRFGESELALITDKAVPPTGRIDKDVLGAAIADVSARINSALEQRYPLPLASVPLFLQQIAADLVHERLQGEMPTDEVKRRGDHARADLKALGTGKMGLGLDAQAQETPEDLTLRTTAPQTVFGGHALDAFTSPSVGGIASSRGRR